MTIFLLFFYLWSHCEVWSGRNHQSSPPVVTSQSNAEWSAEAVTHSALLCDQMSHLMPKIDSKKDFVISWFRLNTLKGKKIQTSLQKVPFFHLIHSQVILPEFFLYPLRLPCHLYLVVLEQQHASNDSPLEWAELVPAARDLSWP